MWRELGPARKEMMPNSLIILMFPLYITVSGTKVLNMSSCERKDIPLFKNITFDSGSTVNLYINGIRQTLIGSWHFFNNYTIGSEYKEQLFCDEYGTIWIKNIQLRNEGKYTLSYKTVGTDVEEQVHLDVMVAPTKYCKPKIRKDDFLLIPLLEVKECGRPQAHVYWLNRHGSSIISNNVVKLDPANDVRTYSACAETPAVACETMLQLSDYCTNITIGRTDVSNHWAEFGSEKDKDNGTPISSGSIEIPTVLFGVLCFICVVSVVVVITLSYRIQKQPTGVSTYRKRKDVAMGPVFHVEMTPLINVPLTSSKDPKHETGDPTSETQDRNYSETKREPKDLRNIKLC